MLAQTKPHPTTVAAVLALPACRASSACFPSSARASVIEFCRGITRCVPALQITMKRSIEGSARPTRRAPSSQRRLPTRRARDPRLHEKEERPERSAVRKPGVPEETPSRPRAAAERWNVSLRKLLNVVSKMPLDTPRSAVAPPGAGPAAALPPELFLPPMTLRASVRHSLCGGLHRIFGPGGRPLVTAHAPVCHRSTGYPAARHAFMLPGTLCTSRKPFACRRLAAIAPRNPVEQ